MRNHAIISERNVHFLNFSLIFCVMFMLTGCWGFLSKQSQLVVINVLDADYYQDCHIAGSINIPFDDFDEKLKTLDKKNRYVLYCSNYACTAAPFLAQQMKDAGFDNVAVYHGGIVQWYQKGYPYQGPAQKSYLKEENEPLDDSDHLSIEEISADDLKAEMQV